MDTPRTSLRPPSRAPWVAVGIALLAAAVWYFALRGGKTPEGGPSVVSGDAGVLGAAKPSGEADDAGPGGRATGTAPLPAVDPARAQALLDSVSQHPLVRLGLAQGELVRRWAVVTDALVQGETPRRELAFLAPSRPFSVVTAGGRSNIAPASYARYDAFADAVASVDAARVATAYRELHAVLEVAYRGLGYPDSALDDVTARALRRLAGAPVQEGEVEVVADEGLFAFADRRLEDQGDVEKHLLRMGPRNTRLIAAKAQELLSALRLPAEATKSP